MTRTATQTDRSYRAALHILQAEQAGLNRRVKAQRVRADQITEEFYAIKAEWRTRSGDDNLTIIAW